MDKRNVLVILCDELRADFLSCYGFTGITTPNIDSLAADGVLFKHSVTVSPVCAPARASMMTGRYVSDHGVFTNDILFREGLEYLPQRMKQNGYRTFAIGKLHHYPAKDSKGFDVAIQMEEGRLKDEDDYLKWIRVKHPEVSDAFPRDENGKFLFDISEYYESFICDRAIEHMESSDSAFFGWVSFQGPHGPLDLASKTTLDIAPPVHTDFDPPCEVARYRKSHSGGNSDHAEYREGYCHLIEELDVQVGKLIAHLKESNQFENTVIIFSSDHGDLMGDYNMRYKGPFLYKGQLEIPFIVANHPNLPKGVESDMLTGNLDIAATALRIAGDDKPFGYSRAVDKMFNESDYQRDVVYSEFSDSVRIISTKTHRFAYYPFTGECELVEILNETVNLANVEEYQAMKATFLMRIIDFSVISKGVRIEAEDLTPKVQQGLARDFPEYKEVIPIAIPLASMHQIELLKADGLDATYNEFCKDREILTHYGKYWEEK